MNEKKAVAVAAATILYCVIQREIPNVIVLAVVATTALMRLALHAAVPNGIKSMANFVMIVYSG